MGNGSCERFNRTLLGMLGTLDPKDKGDWKRHVGPLVHAYNSTRYDSTGYSPFFLMFGRQPRLPIDLAFGIDIGGKHQPLSKFVSSLRENLKNAYDSARRFTSTAAEHQKRNYDRKARAVALQDGDRVLVRIMAFEGKHKISDKWEDDEYVVIRQPNPDVPVYVVRKCNGEGKEKTLHRNLLLPIDFLHDTDEVSFDEKPESTTRKRTLTKPEEEDIVTLETADSDSDEDVDSSVVIDDPVEGPLSELENGIPSHPKEDTPASDTQESAKPVDGDDCHPTVAVDEAPPGDDQVSGNDETGSVSVQDDQDVVAPIAPRVPTPAPRRSTRARQPPLWQQSGEFVMN
ncbi:uncharacterized protein LOC117330212 [Pecten maximus]|uniref:uncharacterized protein LOC117330212 n=1 Tax=Pecten maximus TaxID=6579 RepID=UPI001458C412|nr:uncharacterized protein LOC117330212 [Pecten maximus]